MASRPGDDSNELLASEASTQRARHAGPPRKTIRPPPVKSHFSLTIQIHRRGQTHRQEEAEAEEAEEAAAAAAAAACEAPLGEELQEAALGEEAAAAGEGVQGRRGPPVRSGRSAEMSMYESEIPKEPEAPPGGLPVEPGAPPPADAVPDYVSAGWQAAWHAHI
eukprot:COSAG02_NODE_545_length_20533_cov_5.447663_6_plen_164_part_00